MIATIVEGTTWQETARRETVIAAAVKEGRREQMREIISNALVAVETLSCVTAKEGNETEKATTTAVTVAEDHTSLGIVQTVSATRRQEVK